MLHKIKMCQQASATQNAGFFPGLAYTGELAMRITYPPSDRYTIHDSQTQKNVPSMMVGSTILLAAQVSATSSIE